MASIARAFFYGFPTIIDNFKIYLDIIDILYPSIVSLLNCGKHPKFAKKSKTIV